MTHMKSTPFKELAAVFEKLGRTSSSAAMIDILARFLPALSAQEVKMTAYLLSGKVGPSFSLRSLDSLRYWRRAQSRMLAEPPHQDPEDGDQVGRFRR